MLRKIARKTLWRLGYEVAPRWNPSQVVLTGALRGIFEKYGVGTVLDVGANTGQFGHYLRNDLGFTGRIISFEPSPNDYLKLCEAASGDPLWEALPYALGAEEGTLALNVMTASSFSSFLNLNGSGMFDDVTVAETVDVEVRTLDAIAVGLDLPSTYLKIDTQGFDLEVIKGGSKSIPQMAGLQSEVSVLPLYEGAPSFTDSVDCLRATGHQIAAMAPVNFHNGAVIEFDCVMQRPTAPGT